MILEGQRNFCKNGGEIKMWILGHPFQYFLLICFCFQMKISFQKWPVHIVREDSDKRSENKTKIRYEFERLQIFKKKMLVWKWLPPFTISSFDFLFKRTFFSFPPLVLFSCCLYEWFRIFPFLPYRLISYFSYEFFIYLFFFLLFSRTITVGVK